MVLGHDSANTSATLLATSFSLRSAIDGETEASQQTFEIRHIAAATLPANGSPRKKSDKLIS